MGLFVGSKNGNLLISNRLGKVVLHSNICCESVIATSRSLLEVYKGIYGAKPYFEYQGPEFLSLLDFWVGLKCYIWLDDIFSSLLVARKNLGRI
jgi:hypothetical protein